MKKNDDQLINSLYEKLKNHKDVGLKITRKEAEDFFYFLVNKN